MNPKGYRTETDAESSKTKSVDPLNGAAVIANGNH